MRRKTEHPHPEAHRLPRPTTAYRDLGHYAAAIVAAIAGDCSSPPAPIHLAKGTPILGLTDRQIGDMVEVYILGGTGTWIPACSAIEAGLKPTHWVSPTSTKTALMVLSRLAAMAAAEIGD